MRTMKKLLSLLLAVLMCLSLLPLGALAEAETGEPAEAETAAEAPSAAESDEAEAGSPAGSDISADTESAPEAETPEEAPDTDVSDAGEAQADDAPLAEEETASETDPVPENEEPAEGETSAEPETLEEEQPEEENISDEEEPLLDGDAPEVTRAQWISALVETFSMTVEEDNYPDNYYTDISDEDDFYRDIMVAVEFGVIDLEYGSHFRPNDAATQQFAASTLVFCLGFVPQEEGAVVDEAYISQLAVSRGWFSSYSAENAVTAAQTDKMLADAAEILAADQIDESHDNSSQFAKGVVVFPETTEVYADSEDDILYIENTSVSLKAGDVFVVYYSDLPIALKAVSVTTEDGSYVVAYTTDGAEDAILELDYSGSIPADLDSFVPTDGRTYITEDGYSVEESPVEYELITDGIKLTDTIRVSDISKSMPFPISKGLTATVSGSLTNIVLDYSVKSSGGKVSSATFKLRGNTQLRASVKGSLNAVTGSTFTLGEVRFALVGKATLAFEYNLSGEVAVTWGGNLVAGFGYSGGSFRLIREYNRTSFTVTAEINIKAGLKAELGIDLGLAKASVWASVGAQGVYKFAGYDSGTPRTCQDFAAWLYAQVGAKASLKGVKDWSKTESIYDRNNSPIRTHYHWEDSRQVPSCTRGKDFQDKTGSPPGGYYTDPGSRYFNPGLSDATSTFTDAAGNVIQMWTYTLDDDNKATITGFKGTASAIRIPKTIDGYTVIAVGNDAFRNNRYLGSVIVSDTITRIGNDAFNGCTSLGVISLPDSVTTIGASAFASCGLTSLTLPKSIEFLGSSLLSNTEGVKELSIPKTLKEAGTNSWNDYGVLSGSYVEKLIFEQGTTAVLYKIAKKAAHLKEVIIPSTVTEIAAEAFELCPSLQTISLPDSITYIGNSAFASCGLTSLTLPKTIESLGFHFLSGTEGVKELTIPKTLNEAGTNSWNDFGVLSGSYVEKLIFEEGTTVILHKFAKKASHLKEVIIPSTVTEIAAEAFELCPSLQTISLPDSITKIGNAAFASCGLTSLTLPKNIETLGFNFLSNTEGVKELSIPKTLKEAGTNSWNDLGVLSGSYVEKLVFEKGTTTVFYKIAKKSPHLKEVIIPTTIKEIAAEAFEVCPSLQTITLPDSITSIGASAFASCGLTTITVPDTVTDIGNSVFSGCASLTSVKLPATRIDITKNMFNGCSSLPKIDLPETVENIREGAFQDCTALKEVVWSKAPKLIENSAFANTGFTDFTGPDTITSLGDSAFKGCTELKTVTISDSVTSIGSSAFYDCDALTALTIPDSVTSIGKSLCYDCDALTDVKLGTGITTIPESAFEHCDSLASIVLPYRTASIGEKAFKDCVKFTEVTIPRKTETIPTNAFSYYDKLTIYGISGTYAETYANNNSIKFVNREVKAESVTLSAETLTLNKGKTEKLVMTVTPANFTDEVAWRCSDTDVVTVAEDGTVKALKTGTATIKVTVGSKSASCKVTVVQPVTSVRLSRSSQSLEALDTLQLTASVGPDNALDKSITWISSDENVATVDENGLVTAVAKGVATITATANDGSGVSGSCKVTVTNTAHVVTDPTAMESEHEYPSDCTDFWQYTSAEGDHLFVKFDEKTDIEEGFDYLYIYDGNGNEIGKYTGTELAGQTVEVPGNTVRIQLVSDNAGSAWGFKVESITTASSEISGDLNGDGKADSQDRIDLALALADRDGYSIPEGNAADLNNDGVINRLDRIYLARALKDNGSAA